MSEQYLRYANLVIDQGSPIDVSELRFRFDFKMNISGMASQGTFRITNQLRATAHEMVKRKNYGTIALDVGYRDSHGLIFKGTIHATYYGRDNPTDTVTTIMASDSGHAHNYAVVSKTLAPGSTPKDHLDVAMAAMKPFGVTQGYIGPDLSKPVYPRSVTLYGMARDVISTIARTRGSHAFYERSKVQIVEKDKSVPGSTIVLNSDTGLIGKPTQGMSYVLARVLINPDIRLKGIVQIDQASIEAFKQPFGFPAQGLSVPDTSQQFDLAADGLYEVFQIDVSGDTRGNPWYMDLYLRPQGANVPANLTPIETPGI